MVSAWSVAVGLCLDALMYSVWSQASSTLQTPGASISVVWTLPTLVALRMLASVSASQMLRLKCGGYTVASRCTIVCCSTVYDVWSFIPFFVPYNLVHPSIHFPGAVVLIIKNPLQVLDYEHWQNEGTE